MRTRLLLAKGLCATRGITHLTKEHVQRASPLACNFIFRHRHLPCILSSLVIQSKFKFFLCPLYSPLLCIKEGGKKSSSTIPTALQKLGVIIWIWRDERINYNVMCAPQSSVNCKLLVFFLSLQFQKQVKARTWS